MNNAFSGRSISVIGLLLGISAMVFAVGYLQMIEYLPPCNLCILDRVVVISLCVVFLIALIHNPIDIGRKIYAALAAILSLIGIGICARHIWLQNQVTDSIPECGAGFSHLLKTMPFADFLATIFNGSGSCADIKWQLFGLSIPELTLILFVTFLLLSVIMFVTTGRINHRQGRI